MARLQTGSGQNSLSPELNQLANKARLGGGFPSVGCVNADVQPFNSDNRS